MVALPCVSRLLPKKRSSLALSDASKHAARGFLAAKTLVRSIAKACAQENVVLAHVLSGGKSVSLIDDLVDEFKEKYSSLTKKMLVDGMIRYNAPNETASNSTADEAGEEESKEEYNERKFGKILSIVFDEMNEYFEKIEALKKTREVAASERAVEARASSGKKKRKSEDNGSGPKVARAKKDKNSPEHFLFNEIFKKYAAERHLVNRLTNGKFEVIVEDTKREFQMEHIELDIHKIDKQIRAMYNKMVNDPEHTAVKNKDKEMFQEIYARYDRVKKTNGGKLQRGTMSAIVDGVKLEYGVTDIKVNHLQQKIQAKFAKENPEFEGNNPGQLKLETLTEEERKKRQLLLNEITARYVREKKETGRKKLVDGSLDRIIEQTKNDLGIHDFVVHKASIRGRINRKSLYVQTLGSESPYNVIDEPLVSTINTWLSQGISVTRAQGLELANQLLEGKNLQKDTFGNDLVLDAKWWRNFLDRNKRKLVCSGD